MRRHADDQHTGEECWRAESALLIKWRWGVLGAGRGAGGAGREAGRLTPPRAAPHTARLSARAGHGRENR